MKVKKIKLEVMSSYHSNANQHGANGENGDLSSSVGESVSVTFIHTDASACARERAYTHTKTCIQISMQV